MIFTEASDVDIDHLVPLKNAHLSGGWQWDDDRREDYANSMATDYHLIAVEKYANRAKGARGPEEWQPPDNSYHCEYAYSWIAVKSEWGLTATAAEWAALEEMLTRCPQPVEIVDEGSAVDLDAELARLRGMAGMSDATREQPGLSAKSGVDGSPSGPAGPVSASGPLLITEIMPDPSAVRDSAGEWFEIYNPNPGRAINLEGWTIRDGDRDSHRIAVETLAPPGGYLLLGRNSDENANGGIAIGYQYRDFTLANDGDSIELVSPYGEVGDRVSYEAGLVFPGASMSLDSAQLDYPSLDAEVNDSPGNWCRATTQMPNGDYGTPGTRNDACH